MVDAADRFRGQARGDGRPVELRAELTDTPVPPQ
jgi:hypothetical protein